MWSSTRSWILNSKGRYKHTTKHDSLNQHIHIIKFFCHLWSRIIQRGGLFEPSQQSPYLPISSPLSSRRIVPSLEFHLSEALVLSWTCALDPSKLPYRQRWRDKEAICVIHSPWWSRGSRGGFVSNQDTSAYLLRLGCWRTKRQPFIFCHRGWQKLPQSLPILL